MRISVLSPSLSFSTFCPATDWKVILTMARRQRVNPRITFLEQTLHLVDGPPSSPSRVAPRSVFLFIHRKCTFFCKSSAKGPLRCFLRTVLLQNCSKTTFFLKSSSYSETIFITSLHTCKHSLHILCLRQLSIRTLKEILHAIFMPFHIIDLFLATSSATQPERCK